MRPERSSGAEQAHRNKHGKGKGTDHSEEPRAWRARNEFGRKYSSRYEEDEEMPNLNSTIYHPEDATTDDLD